MSGHSHAKTVKRTKDANAAVKGKIFSKLSKLISIAAKEGGIPETNTKLKQAIEEARKANMPKDNIEKAIKRGTGELSGEAILEEVSYEILSPGGIAVIVEGITDNRNRSLAEIRQIANKYNGKLANEGSLKWQFEKKGIITIQINPGKDKEDIELKAIEAGADEIEWYQEEDTDYLEIRTAAENIENAKQNLQNMGIQIESSNLGWVAKEKISLEENEIASLNKMFDELDENDAVQNIYSNLK